jgi:hypothetical protein
MAGGAEVPAFAREGQEILVATIFAFNAGETIVEDAAIKIAVDHLFHISTEETVLGCKALVIDLLKFLKVILNALVILGILRFPRTIYGGDVGHVRFSSGSKSGMPDEVYCKLN